MQHLLQSVKDQLLAVLLVSKQCKLFYAIKRIQRLIKREKSQPGDFNYGCLVCGAVAYRYVFSPSHQRSLASLSPPSVNSIHPLCDCDFITETKLKLNQTRHHLFYDSEKSTLRHGKPVVTCFNWKHVILSLFTYSPNYEWSFSSNPVAGKHMIHISPLVSAATTSKSSIGSEKIDTSSGKTAVNLKISVKKELQHSQPVKSSKMDITEEDVVTTADIKTFLTEKDMKFDESFTCFITRCLRLAQTNKKSAPSTESTSKQLFINITTGHFVCQHCNKRGKWQDLKDNIQMISSQTSKQRKVFECFKDVGTVEAVGRQSKQALELWEGAMPVQHCAKEVFEQIQEHFNIHELHASTLEKFGVRFDIKTNGLILPAFDGERRLVGIRRLTCTIPEEDSNTRVMQDSLLPKSGVLGLFGLNMLTKDVTEIVITCSELDAMAVFQETRAPVVAFPAGYSSLPQELLPVLERYTNLVLWFGDDVRAWEAAKLFAKKLNDKRCCIIRPSIEDPSPFECLRRGLSLKSVLSKARPVVHKSIVTFSHLRQEIFSELTHSEQVAGVKWKRYVALNRLLKGHRRGELTVFTGATGSGKTTFISDYSLDLCMQGVSTLWGSFEINNIRLGKVMLQQFSQCNLSKHLEDFDRWANGFEELPMYFMTFFGQENIKKVIEAMSHAVYVHDIAHVVVDNLQFMMGTNGEWSDRFAKQDMFISAFRKFATNMNCHVTLVVHPRKERDADDLTTASVFGSAKATQEADNVMILQDKRLSSVRGRKYLQITKNRFDGELGVMLLKFDKDSLSFAIKEKPFRQKSRDDTGVEDNAKFHDISEDPADVYDHADGPESTVRDFDDRIT